MKNHLTGQIIEISGKNRYLKKERGFLSVYKNKQKIGIVAFKDIQAIIFNAYHLTYTHQLILALAEYNIPIIFCNNKHIPSSIILPFDSYFHQSRRMILQAQATKPTNKSLWKEIVQSKIRQQGVLLKMLNKKSAELFIIAKKVKSDDSTNCEGQAARFYFKELFGKDFLRRQELSGINAMLNYGYMVFRAAVARAVISAGLSPSIGIKHCNPNNSMPLVDDLLEPFRAFIDNEVYQITIEEKNIEIDKNVKIRLVNVLSKQIKADRITTTPNQIIYKFASSVGQIYHGDGKKLFLPEMSYI
jgi:CRISP-associated protein Cas1